MRALISAIATTMALMAPTFVAAQFAPAVVINDSVVSQYELDQRAGLLGIFGTPGNLQDLALEQLIEDRLKLEALNAAGLQITDEGLLTAMSEFAARADMDIDQFLALLTQSGVAEETLRDFVLVNASWRDFIRSRFGARAQVSEDDIDRALGEAGGSSAIEVLLSEIIIPAPPPQAASALATAQRIAQFTTTAAFEAEARRVSALPTRTRGGRLDWLPIANYPRGLRGILLDLAPGEVTAPIPITNGVALFQMRGVREVTQAAPEPAVIEYFTFLMPGAGTPRGVRNAERLAARTDTCDDLYGAAAGLPEDRLTREVLPPEQIPQDIALILANLDSGETDHSLTRSEGQTILFLMICSRTPVLGDGVDRDTIRNQLRSQRLNTFADAFLADLVAAATITYP